MLKKRKPFFFEDHLKKFEAKLLEYFVESGFEKGRNEIESHILGYLMLHQYLTQKQIKELSKDFYVKNTRRGISNGSISAFLNGIYLKIGIIKKRKVEGSNYLFEYSITGHISRSTLESSKIGLKLINDFNSDIKHICNLLKQISTKEFTDLEFYNLFVKRMNDFVEFIKSYKILMEKSISYHQKDSDDKITQLKSSVNIEGEEQEKISNVTIYDLEEKLITVIIKSPLFQFLKSDYIRIMGYFITREKLTQKNIKNFTGYSLGHISQGLNKLLRLDIIQSYKENGVRQSTYTMRSIGFSLMGRYLGAIQKTNEYKAMLIEMYKELNDKKEEWQNFNGYSQIKNFIKNRIEMMDYFDFLEELIEIEKNKFSFNK